MRVLITGASGFIGGFLVNEALKRGYEVWAGVRQNSDRSNLQDERIRFIDLRYSNVAALTSQLKLLKDEFGMFDFVIHNAGLTKTLKKDAFHTVNAQYTKNFIDALYASG